VKSPTTRRLTRGVSRSLVFVEEVVPSLLLALIVIAITADVIGRYVFANPLQGAAEISLIAFVWATYLAVAGVARQGRHIAIDVVTGTFSPRWQAIADIIVQLIIMGVLGYLVINGLDFFAQGHFTNLVGTGLSRRWLMVAIPVSAILMIGYSARDLIIAARGAISGDFQRVSTAPDEDTSPDNTPKEA
jgi:TRAP-type C4-dicarboxylate transport system permease small subunit